MFYYLYQITNTVNNKIYIGVHKTNNLNDGYMGSGKVIQSAIEKYGLYNFKKDILEFFENAELMYAKEKEVVDDDFLLREDVYNLRRGGVGGFDHLNKTGKNTQWIDNDSRCKKITKRISDKWKRGDYANTTFSRSDVFIEAAKTSFSGKKHSDETKVKISEKMKSKQSGQNNSQYGTMWITNGKQNMKVCKSEELPSGWFKGRTLAN